MIHTGLLCQGASSHLNNNVSIYAHGGVGSLSPREDDTGVEIVTLLKIELVHVVGAIQDAIVSASSDLKAVVHHSAGALSGDPMFQKITSQDQTKSQGMK